MWMSANLGPRAWVQDLIGWSRPHEVSECFGSVMRLRLIPWLPAYWSEGLVLKIGL